MKKCKNQVTWTICPDGKNPSYDFFTQSCDEHLVEMLEYVEGYCDLERVPVGTDEFCCYVLDEDAIEMLGVGSSLLEFSKSVLET